MRTQHNVGPMQFVTRFTPVGFVVVAAVLIGCANNNDSAQKPAGAPVPAKVADSHVQQPTPARTPPAPTRTDPTPEPERPSRGDIKVQFGVMPGDYEDTAKGVLVGSVVSGASAEAAGIQAGDRLMTWNGQEITDIGTWMRFLAVANPGDVVTVGVTREGKTVPMKVTLKARQD